MLMKKIKQILQSKLAQNGLWLMLLQGFNTIVPLVTIPYITRMFSKTAYGEFSIALNWVGYFQVVVEYGFGLSASRKIAMSKKRENLSVIRSNVLFARLFLFFVCLFAFVILVYFSKTEKTQKMCMLILFFMVFSEVFQQSWFFQGIAEMKNIAIVSVISRTISVILIFIFIKSSNDLYLYCIFYVSTYLISSATGCFIVKRKYKVDFCLTKRSEIWAELIDAWPLFISSAMTKIFGSIGITILGFVATSEDVAVYSAIYKVPYVLTLLFSAMGQTLYPKMCQLYSDSFSYGYKNVKKYGLPILSVFSIFGLLIIFANNFIVKIAFGDGYADYSLLLVPFIIWTLLGIANNFLGIQTLVASGHQKEYSRDFTISVVAMVILMLVFGNWWQAYGIAIASMCSELFLSLLLIRDVRKIYKTQYS